jgi:hypothetical protein
MSPVLWAGGFAGMFVAPLFRYSAILGILYLAAVASLYFLWERKDFNE